MAPFALSEDPKNWAWKDGDMCPVVSREERPTRTLTMWDSQPDSPYVQPCDLGQQLNL